MLSREQIRCSFFDAKRIEQEGREKEKRKKKICPKSHLVGGGVGGCVNVLRGWPHILFDAKIPETPIEP